MEFKPDSLYEAARSNAELESLIERIVASAVARIEGGADMRRDDQGDDEGEYRDLFALKTL